jgi:hypothetical protein
MKNSNRIIVKIFNMMTTISIEKIKAQLEKYFIKTKIYQKMYELFLDKIKLNNKIVSFADIGLKKN